MAPLAADISTTEEGQARIDGAMPDIAAAAHLCPDSHTPSRAYTLASSHTNLLTHPRTCFRAQSLTGSQTHTHTCSPTSPLTNPPPHSSKHSHEQLAVPCLP
eukprot:GHVU01018053.1.p3 GENE.GHVU01018053.1~~GHVU01018053.1.p3  ORF type:complete len:102 (+),score=6.60 GHVU01018053.1:237-542(+)